jgi:hypothetical protein
MGETILSGILGIVAITLLLSAVFLSILLWAIAFYGVGKSYRLARNWLRERRAQRPHHSIDEQPDSHLVGDVPRIHPELHVNRNAPEAK